MNIPTNLGNPVNFLLSKLCESAKHWNSFVSHCMSRTYSLRPHLPRLAPRSRSISRDFTDRFVPNVNFLGNVNDMGPQEGMWQFSPSSYATSMSFTSRHMSYYVPSPLSISPATLSPLIILSTLWGDPHEPQPDWQLSDSEDERTLTNNPVLKLPPTPPPQSPLGTSKSKDDLDMADITGPKLWGGERMDKNPQDFFQSIQHVMLLRHQLGKAKKVQLFCSFLKVGTEADDWFNSLSTTETASMDAIEDAFKT